VPVGKLLYSLSPWGMAVVGVNDVRRLSFPPQPRPEGEEFPDRHC